MRRLPPTFLLVAASLIVAAEVSAQVIVYDWPTGARTDSVRLRAGERLNVEVRGLNTLCYTPRVSVSATEAKIDLTAVARSLSPVETKADEKATPPFSGPTPTPPPPPGVTKGLEGTLDSALGQLGQAAAYLERARIWLRSGESAYRASEHFTSTLDAPPCALGRGWNITHFVESWPGGEPLDALLRQGQSGLTDAAAQIEAADREIQSATSISLTGEQRTERDSLAAARLNQVREARRRHADLTTQLAAERVRLRSAAPQMDALLGTTTIRTSLRANHDVEKLVVVVAMDTLRGRKAVPLAPDTIQEPVHRRFRAFVSTGMFASLMRHRDYERTNRPILRDSTTADGETVRVPTDSTYSTYANQRSGLGDVISPTVQLNMVFWDFWSPGSGFPVMASLGAAARSVGGSILPEPFAGLSLGMHDRIVLTTGIHYGRNEKLLLTLPGERPEDVALRRIPTGISKDDAVGVEWRFAPQFTISVRL